jgi:hypothetical protein
VELKPTPIPQPAAPWLQEQGFPNQDTVPRVPDLGTEMVAWRISAQRSNFRRRRRYWHFMSKSRVLGLVLMVAGVCVYGTAPDWLALCLGLLGLAATLFADARYLRHAIARRHFGFLIDRAILLTALAVAAAIWVSRLIGSGSKRYACIAAASRK